MSKYTITIKNLLDNGFDFGLNSYPIFDENYRNTLNQNILNHYYESEIGLETPALFKFYLNQKLNEIMPYYNVLYEKQKALLNNIEHNVNLTETLHGTNNKNDINNVTSNTESTSSSSNSGTANSKNFNNYRSIYTESFLNKLYAIDSDDHHFLYSHLSAA